MWFRGRLSRETDDNPVTRLSRWRMASSSSENSKGAKRRTSGLPTARVRVGHASLENHGTEDGRDSGLSSESSTPTNGSPPPRQPRASSSGGQVVGANGAASSSVLPRAKNSSGRYSISSGNGVCLLRYFRLAQGETHDSEAVWD